MIPKLKFTAILVGRGNLKTFRRSLNNLKTQWLCNSLSNSLLDKSYAVDSHNFVADCETKTTNAVNLKLGDVHTNSTKSGLLNSLRLYVHSNGEKLSQDLHNSVQQSFVNLANEFTLKEAVLFSDALVKTNSHITSSDVLNILIEKFCSADTLDIYTTTSIIKAVKNSESNRGGDHRKQISKLVEYCVRHGDQLTAVNFTHLCDLVRSTGLYTPHLLDIAFRNLCEHLNEVRTKDIERVVCCLAYFGHQPRQGLNAVIEEFSKRTEENMQYPLRLLYFTYDLSVFGIYPTQLIKSIFDDSFVDKVVAMDMNSEINLLTVNTSMAVDLHGECEDLLLRKPLKVEFDTDSIDFLMEKPSNKLSITEQELISCYSLMKSKFGEKVMFSRLLPFTRYPDIVIVDRPEMKSKLGLELRPNMMRNCTAVIVGHRNYFADKNSKQLRGIHSLRLRLLSKIGYKIIEISIDQLYNSLLNGSYAIDRHNFMTDYETNATKEVDVHTNSTKSSLLNSLRLCVHSNGETLSPDVHNFVQQSFVNLANEFTLEDAVLFSDAFFKTNSHITSSDVLNILIEKFCSADTLDNYTTTSIIKAVKYSESNRRGDHRRQISKLVEFCVRHGDQLTAVNFTHLCDLVRSTGLYTPHLLDIAFRNLCEHLNEVRTKDIERVVCCLAYFGHQPRQGLNAVIEEFSKRTEEHMQHPLTLLYFTYYLSVFGIYPKQLIKSIFDDNFVEKVLAMDMLYKINLLSVNTSMAVDLYGGCEHLLLKKPLKVEFDTDSIDFLMEKPSNKLSITERELISCYLLMKMKFGEKVMFSRLLPFTRYPDIVIVDRPEMKSKLGLELRPNMIRNCTAVIFGHRNYFADKNSKRLRGIHSLRLRLLSKIGYKIIKIPHDPLEPQSYSNVQ